MGIYSINPQSNVDSANILNIMSQLIKDISNSIQSIYNIVLQIKYNLFIDNIKDVLDNYLKIYNFYNYGITHLYVQVYNQNIDLVVFASIQLYKYKYIIAYSKWNNFSNGVYYNKTKYIYNVLTPQQKNDLVYSIISGDLYFIPDINFVYNGLNTSGMLLKPKYSNCECNNQTINEYSYISTIYYN
jgi:hypothetical protein